MKETFDYQRERFWLIVGIFWLKTVCNRTLPFIALSEPEALERRVRWQGIVDHLCYG